ncbi:hypothetical protein [Natronobacterium gregoryi]|uniref:Uncharacterized protein n=2 Tax=Natronobacterium gregoryi TaxID=44930 RepID=L0AGL2_NATGS|nr:hypothetical protein [Natronobacterium gregoryi]AFZ73038.1 hypothetical protein Natgr_1853 [Natronobacterium gregoryi SP2]ELY70855.1 hypothetical protein C490_06177 [Natronobacterium gregoryi SP2]PLK20436.1 hypothetical protein CYV19_09925 [Natronobacterium gregoryi SP2]SFI63007.1 hypothetical protein SAMN05443661_102228 [Natronobacterium gregoryi]
MAETHAEPVDVRLEYDTNRTDKEIEKLIEKKTRAIEQSDGDDLPAPGTDNRTDLEAVLTAIHIATKLDRAASNEQLGNAQRTYEEDLVEELRADARRLGATDELLGINATKPQADFEAF